MFPEFFALVMQSSKRARRDLLLPDILGARYAFYTMWQAYIYISYLQEPRDLVLVWACHMATQPKVIGQETI